MTKKILFLALFFNYASAYAQTVKTDVLIVGAGASGVAAAIQCARSNVKAALITADDHLFTYESNQNWTIQNNLDIHSGFWGEFRDSLANHYHVSRPNDTVQNKPVFIDSLVAEEIVKKITDSTKNLSVYLNTGFSTIKKDGDRWEVSITKNDKVNKFFARVVIDATNNGAILSLLGLKSPDLVDLTGKNNPLLCRTSIAVGTGSPGEINAGKQGVWNLPMNAVIVKGADNLLVTELLPGRKDVQFLPFQLEAGQGAGALAAFCAFYKTNTQKLRVRLVQSELLSFKAYILPFTDINPGDPNWRSIQQVAATGLLKGVENKSQLLFKPDLPVNTSEVKPVLIEIYTRAFLWFNKETPGEKFTVGNLLSFISDYTLTDPALLNETIRKAWKSQYHFKQNFDLNRQINRVEFAVLANKYLNPFARTVDLDGKLVN